MLGKSNAFSSAFDAPLSHPLLPTAEHPAIPSCSRSKSNPIIACALSVMAVGGAVKSRFAELFGEEEIHEIKTLAIPAFGSILADPLMSLIDTACIGQTSSIGLAAMGPNTAIFNFIFQLFTFLGIATTGFVARCIAKEKYDKAQHFLSHALMLAAAMGAAMAVVLHFAALPLLRVLSSNNLALIAAGEPYVRVRLAAIPFVLAATVAQGGCLGRQDSLTPLYIFIFAAAVNVVLDFVLVLPAGLNLGLTGAAYATVVAQILGCLAFLVVLYRRGHLPRRPRLPALDELAPLVNVSGMLMLGSLCRMGVYTAITYVATAMGTLTVATHQIALQVYWFLTYFTDPLFVAATSFIARDIKVSTERATRMAAALVGLSLAMGGVLAAASSAIPLALPHLFTQDPAVVANLASVAAPMGVAQLVSSVVFVIEGVLIGAGDVTYLARVHCLNFLVLAVYLATTVHLHGGLAAIWGAMIVNQVLRLGQHAMRLRSAASPLRVPKFNDCCE